MRRLFLAVSLLSLTACGGEMSAEETQAPLGETSSEVTIICNATDLECLCGANKTQAKCSSTSACTWDSSRSYCVPKL